MSDFWRDIRRKDGHCYWCRFCHKESRSYAIGKIKYHAFTKKNKRKIRIYTKVLSAVRSGKLIKENCFLCGASRTHAHHISYDYPLKVIWLCIQHHRDTHKLYEF